MSRKGLILLISAGLFGCAANPVTKEQVQRANYGEQTDESYATSTIDSVFRRTLIDPDSMKLACSKPKKGWARDSAFADPNYGYVVYCEVNAKNRMGGYSGAKPYVFLFRGNRLTSIGDGPNYDLGHNYGYAN